jgi:hypothetical protein
MMRPLNEREQSHSAESVRKTALPRAFLCVREVLGQFACLWKRALSGHCGIEVSRISRLDHGSRATHVAGMNTATCNNFFGICREIICA